VQGELEEKKHADERPKYRSNWDAREIQRDTEGAGTLWRVEAQCNHRRVDHEEGHIEGEVRDLSILLYVAEEEED
jgi:hypothetical protein